MLLYCYIIIIIIIIIIIRFEIQGSRVQNRLRAMDFFQGVKILSTRPRGGTISRGPESYISGTLKNLKPEKIGL